MFWKRAKEVVGRAGGETCHMHKLSRLDSLTRQAREKQRVLLRADIDFDNAFNSDTHGGLWA
jgi:hypothetical protein